MDIQRRELDTYFRGKGLVLDLRGNGLCGHTQDVMVTCVDITDAGRCPPQLTGELQNPPPTPSLPPAKRKRMCHNKADSEAQLAMVLDGVVTVVCSALNYCLHTYSSKTAIQL